MSEEKPHLVPRIVLLLRSPRKKKPLQGVAFPRNSFCGLFAPFWSLWLAALTPASVARDLDEWILLCDTLVNRRGPVSLSKLSASREIAKLQISGSLSLIVIASRLEIRCCLFLERFSFFLGNVRILQARLFFGESCSTHVWLGVNFPENVGSRFVFSCTA